MAMLNLGPAELAVDWVFLIIHLIVDDSRVVSEVEREVVDQLGAKRSFRTWLREPCMFSDCISYEPLFAYMHS